MHVNIFYWTQRYFKYIKLILTHKAWFLKHARHHFSFDFKEYPKVIQTYIFLMRTIPPLLTKKYSANDFLFYLCETLF